MERLSATLRNAVFWQCIIITSKQYTIRILIYQTIQASPFNTDGGLQFKSTYHTKRQYIFQFPHWSPHQCGCFPRDFPTKKYF